MKSVLISLIFLSVIAMNSDKPAYRIFDSKGEQSDYHELLKKVQNADIVFFGELHNNPICHWLELEITKDLYKLKKDNLILGAEMFEADNQLIINEYLNEEIKKILLSQRQNFGLITKLIINHCLYLPKRIS